ncbi:MAG: DUF2480 family protein [Candidatus Marinimicrobia bacterium]|nr:DUF2480 family protein [Candidatus Neomarinimicrobiota bacterium]
MTGTVTMDWDVFLDDGILKEKSFRQKIESIDWISYKGKNVVIKGCSTAHVPTWAYMMITAHLAPHTRHILFGEPRRAVSIYKQ